MENKTVLRDRISRLSPVFDADAFSRLDTSNDKDFYAKDRLVDHLDSLALETVERLIGTLIIEERPHILDLMAGWNSHIPNTIAPAKVVGLGLNEKELRQNAALTEHRIHDLNQDVRLPFEEESFDVVLNTVSVDYITHPILLFQEVGRILKPGGLFLVTFSNRFFPQKAVKVWLESNEEERIILVEEFFKAAGCFENPTLFVSKGLPRPAGDKYAGVTDLSDPVFALYAEKKGVAPERRKRPHPISDSHALPARDDLEERKKRVKQTLRCPHCDEKLLKWAVPENPFAATWDNPYMYICFNDECPYLVRGWDVMSRQGNASMSYRQMFNPESGALTPMPVPNLKALKDGIMEED